MNQSPATKTAFIIQQAPQVVIDSNSLDLMNQSSNAMNIEKRIKSSFYWHLFLVYFQIVLSVASLIFYIIIHVTTEDILLSIVSTITMIQACVLAILARSRIDAGKQALSFKMFCLATILNLITTIVSLIIIKDLANNLGQEDLAGNPTLQSAFNKLSSNFVSVIAILFIPFQLIVGIALSLGARVLSRLMDERAKILFEMSTRY